MDLKENEFIVSCERKNNTNWLLKVEATGFMNAVDNAMKIRFDNGFKYEEVFTIKVTNRIGLVAFYNMETFTTGNNQWGWKLTDKSVEDVKEKPVETKRVRKQVKK